jgi:probable O-glycosylation ligase (exosortase A-associated)
MILVALMLVNSKRQIFALTWVVTFSLAILGIKGGLFTLAHGGAYRVWGPPDSFIADNNEFALALVMTIPLLRFLQLQLSGFWARHAMTTAMVLCAAAALGSQSRGAMLGIGAMSVFLWWRGSRSRFSGGFVLLLIGVGLVSFMPEFWSDRMGTIADFQDDRSAMGRISAWWNAWNLAFHYPLGVGFNAARPELFAKFSPYPDMVHAAHSIYFQVLGNHGFIGLAIFLMLWTGTWRNAGWLRRNAAAIPEAKWCSEFGTMAQVSLVGYAVGGAFLSLSYFDLPYDVMVLILASRVWIEKRAWQTEAPYAPRWHLIPGLSPVNTP